MLGLQVDDDVVELPVVRQAHHLGAEHLRVLVQVDERDGDRRRRVGGPQLLGGRPEREMEQRLLAGARHVPRQQQLRQVGDAPRLVDLDVEPVAAGVRGARVGHRHRPRAVVRILLRRHAVVGPLEAEERDDAGRRRRGGGGERRRRRRRQELVDDVDLEVVERVRARALADPERDDDGVVLAVPEEKRMGCSDNCARIAPELRRNCARRTSAARSRPGTCASRRRAAASPASAACSCRRRPGTRASATSSSPASPPRAPRTRTRTRATCRAAGTA